MRRRGYEKKRGHASFPVTRFELVERRSIDVLIPMTDVSSSLALDLRSCRTQAVSAAAEAKRAFDEIRLSFYIPGICDCVTVNGIGFFVVEGILDDDIRILLIIFYVYIFCLCTAQRA